MAKRNIDISISKQVATEVTITMIEELKLPNDEESFYKMTDFLVKWITSYGTDKDTLICRQAALKRAVYSIKIFNIKETKDILRVATKFFNYFIS